MHRSRLAGLIIDCRGEDVDSAARFWSQALGCTAAQSRDPADGNYVPLRTGSGDLGVEVQRVDHPSGVHLDIESDDVEHEVTRLEKLGARRLRNVEDWVVLEAPSGQRFCVIQAESSEFRKRANVWE